MDYNVESKNPEKINSKPAQMLKLLGNGNDAAAGTEMLYEIIDRLVEYSRHDLQNEEAAMALHGYPEFSEHLKEHALFKSRVDGYLSIMQFGNTPPAEEVRGFLEDWLAFHIAMADGDYSRFLFQMGFGEAHALSAAAG